MTVLLSATDPLDLTYPYRASAIDAGYEFAIHTDGVTVDITLHEPVLGMRVDAETIALGDLGPTPDTARRLAALEDLMAQRFFGPEVLA